MKGNMRKIVEKKLAEIRDTKERTHQELVTKSALIECLESLLIEEKKPKQKTEPEEKQA